MEKRIFGKTGHSVTVITIGGFSLGQISQEKTNELIFLTMKHGVNMIDVASSYGEAELRLAPILKKHRNKFNLQREIRLTKNLFQDDSLDIY